MGAKMTSTKGRHKNRNSESDIDELLSLAKTIRMSKVPMSRGPRPLFKNMGFTSPMTGPTLAVAKAAKKAKKKN